MEKNETNQVILGRVRNRIDLIGRVIKINGNFVCLEIPNFRGYLEYPSTLIEFIEDFNLVEQREPQS